MTYPSEYLAVLRKSKEQFNAPLSPEQEQILLENAGGVTPTPASKKTPKPKEVVK